MVLSSSSVGAVSTDAGASLMTSRTQHRTSLAAGELAGSGALTTEDADRNVRRQNSIRLYDWAPSPFSLKVRAILDYKGLPCVRVPILRPTNLLKVLRHGKIGKAPAIELDGRLLVDSTDIAYEVEARFPEPSIIPADPGQRALCHALEEWADESLYFVGLYFQWDDLEGRKMIPQVFGSSLYARAMYRFYLHRVRKQTKGQGTARKPLDHVRRDLERHLDAVEQLVRPGLYLLGERPYLCDFAMLGQLTYLGRTPEGSRRLAARPAIQHYLQRLKAHGSSNVRPPTRST
jgi:glutathione S-transferase